MLTKESSLKWVKLGYTHNAKSNLKKRKIRRIQHFSDGGYKVDPIPNKRIIIDNNNGDEKVEIEESKEDNSNIDKIFKALITMGWESSFDVEDNYDTNTKCIYNLSIKDEFGTNIFCLFLLIKEFWFKINLII